MRKTWNFFVGSLAAIATAAVACAPASAQQPRKPNIFMIWGDDIGGFNISAYDQGVVDYRYRPIGPLLEFQR